MREAARSGKRFALTGGVAAGLGALLLVAALPEAWRAAAFCRAPAWLAAAFFGVPVSGAQLAFGSGRIVAVTRACDGSDFFALICGVLTWHALKQGVKLWRMPLFWCAAWGVTVLVNGMRVIVTVLTRGVAEWLLPERFLSAVHLVSGVMVFFPALMAVWWFCGRRDFGKDAGFACIGGR
jgi:exosortase/archaeosortase family protein